MKRLCSLLLFTLVTPANGEIVFDWKYAPIQKEKQVIIEERVKIAAAKFLEPRYTSFGIETVIDWSDIPIDEDELGNIEEKIKSAASYHEKKEYKAFEAELQFDWAETSISSDTTTQKIIEERAKAAAIKWAEKKYPSYGPYDFLKSKETYTVTVDDVPQLAELWGGRHIIFDESLVNDPVKLQMVAFHEFAHCYDFHIADNILRLEFNNAKSRNDRIKVIKHAEEIEEIAHNIRFSSERRAQQRTSEYAAELKIEYDIQLQHFRDGSDIKNE